MTTKTFDCVQMKRRGAELVRQRLAGMTRQQQLEYWRQQTALLRRRQAAARSDKPDPPASQAS